MMESTGRSFPGMGSRWRNGGMANIFMAHDGEMDEWAIFSFVV